MYKAIKIWFCLWGGLIGFVEGSTSEPPNVIIIYTDDQGTLDLQSFGASDLQTPHMDAIVESGVRFTQFYGAPVCSPSRVSLLTGKSPQKAGVTGNISASPNQTKGLPGDTYTVVDLFKEGGYSTAHIGKWHLGYAEDKQPLAHGFDYSFGHLVGCIDNYSHYFYWRGPNRHDLYENGKETFRDGEFFPELMLEKATRFIDDNKEGPFFIYFAMNTPHYPYQGYPEWLEYYRNKGLPYPRDLYAAFLSTQDEIIGRLIHNLEELGLRENTIIILQSDNGHSTEERAHFGGGYAGIYRGAKACLFEAGYRVPAAISWPGKLPANTSRNQLAVNTDWLPTLAELCKLDLKVDDLDGKSLVPVMRNAGLPSPHKSGYCWKFRDQWVVRKGPWKLLGNPEDTTDRMNMPQLPARFLVNLDEDPGEQNNLAQKYPEKVVELEAIYSEWNME